MYVAGVMKHWNGELIKNQVWNMASLDVRWIMNSMYSCLYICYVFHYIFEEILTVLEKSYFNILFRHLHRLWYICRQTYMIYDFLDTLNHLGATYLYCCTSDIYVYLYSTYIYVRNSEIFIYHLLSLFN